MSYMDEALSTVPHKHHCSKSTHQCLNKLTNYVPTNIFQFVASCCNGHVFFNTGISTLYNSMKIEISLAIPPVQILS